MPRSFFSLLAAEKSLQRLLHHEMFLRSCQHLGFTPKGLRLHRTPNVAPAFCSPSFSLDWNNVLFESSLALQSLVIDNTSFAKRKAAERIETLTNAIIDTEGLNEYLRIRSDVSRVLAKFTATLDKTAKKKLLELKRLRSSQRSDNSLDYWDYAENQANSDPPQQLATPPTAESTSDLTTPCT